MKSQFVFSDGPALPVLPVLPVLIVLLAVGLHVSSALGRSYQCEGAGGLSVQLHQGPDDQRLAPALMLISGPKGLLLERRGDDIRQYGMDGNLLYGAVGNDELAADWAILQIEIEPRDSSATPGGKLVLIRAGEPSEKALDCTLVR